MSQRRWARIFRTSSAKGCLSALIVAALLSALSVAAQAPSAPRSAQAKYIVVLDAAHGGEDSGATLKSGQQEKALTLAFVQKLRTLLTSRGAQVILTRENDSTLTPDQRAEAANRVQAQACVSIHFTETGSGAHLFSSDLAATPAGSRFLPWKTAQSAWVQRSLALTGRVNSVLQQGGLAVTLGRTALPGVDSMACPALAVEIAPERAPGSVTLLSAVDDPKYQTRMVEALTAAIMTWKLEVR